MDQAKEIFWGLHKAQNNIYSSSLVVYDRIRF